MFYVIINEMLLCQRRKKREGYIFLHSQRSLFASTLKFLLVSREAKKQEEDSRYTIFIRTYLVKLTWDREARMT